MSARRRFPRDVVAAILDGKHVYIRAGSEPHRFIGIWAVVVQGRVFARSWSLKPRSWWRTFLVEPRGAMRLADRELTVRAVQTRSERLKDAVSRAYLEKYNSPGSAKYARDLCRAKSRANDFRTGASVGFPGARPLPAPDLADAAAGGRRVRANCG
jgi:hypothetical protein